MRRRKVKKGENKGKGGEFSAYTGLPASATVGQILLMRRGFRQERPGGLVLRPQAAMLRPPEPPGIELLPQAPPEPPGIELLPQGERAQRKQEKARKFFSMGFHAAHGTSSVYVNELPGRWDLTPPPPPPRKGQPAQKDDEVKKFSRAFGEEPIKRMPIIVRRLVEVGNDGRGRHFYDYREVEEGIRELGPYPKAEIKERLKSSDVPGTGVQNFGSRVVSYNGQERFYVWNPTKGKEKISDIQRAPLPPLRL